MRYFFILFLTLTLGACSYKNPLSDMKFQTTPAPPYILANWYKIESLGSPLKVYIEGDGQAFDRFGQPTDNPTPKGTFLRKLAAHDPSSNVVYLARPCQFLKPNCTEEDWTTGRFSEKVINSMDTELKSLMKKARTDKIILIGFSGGAQVAGLLAVRHPNNTQKLITVSGVLDHQAWTEYHGDPPLTASINLKDYQDELKKIPQTHYAGEDDTVVPANLIQDFAPDSTIVVSGATHDSGYSSIYDQIYEVK